DRSFWVLVALGVSIRLVYAFSARVEPWSDFEAYDRMAENIIDGLGWHSRGLSAISPGYPAFLAGLYIIHRSIESAWIANALLGGLSVLLATLLCGHYWNDKRLQLGTALLVALYPDLVVYGGILASENLATPLLLLTMILLAEGQRKRGFVWWLAGGAALGALSLVRGMMLGLLPMFIFWIWRYVYQGSFREASKPILAFLAAALLLISPWTIRNYVVHQAFVPITTELGLGLWGGNNPEANGEWMQDFLNRQVMPSGLSEVQVSRYQTGQALSFVMNNPVDALVLAGKKFCLFWGIKMDGVYQHQAVIPPWLALLISTLGQSGMVSFFLIGCYLTWRWSPSFGLALLVSLYLLLLTVVFYYLTRYRLMLYPVWVSAVVYAVSHLPEFLRGKKGRNIAAKAGVCLFTFLILNWSWIIWRNLDKVLGFLD
ncbi:MAG TPA: hypothetical protein DIU35_08955, partial [Candidatus Latescibacteria bacterium]|nr:hypothetical protein [Candidatus Latescibacterota bacterium]